MPRRLTKTLTISLLFLSIYFLLILFPIEVNSLLPQPTAPVNTNSVMHDPASPDIITTFCPSQECEPALADFIRSANSSLHCAFYDLDLPLVKEALLDQSTRIPTEVVIDEDNAEEFTAPFVTVNTASGLMHHKFCIVDGRRVSTGSFNPTERGAYHNDNNLIIISSPRLAENYLKEFFEVRNNTKRGDTTTNTHLLIRNTSIENYFCPEDDCAEAIIEELKDARHSIYFMTFSFTHDNIAIQLAKQHHTGLDIKGVMEARQVSQYSQYEFLHFQEVEVYKDANPANMHHKVFIIDNRTVITGSFNPSANADTRNDENVLIIHDEGVAATFLQEFQRVFSHAKDQTVSSPTP